MLLVDDVFVLAREPEVISTEIWQVSTNGQERYCSCKGNGQTNCPIPCSWDSLRICVERRLLEYTTERRASSTRR